MLDGNRHRAARRIGYAIAKKLGEDGANVMLADVSSNNLKESANKLKTNDITMETINCDVTDRSGTNHLDSKTVEIFDNLDLLANNLGTATRSSFTDLESWYFNNRCAFVTVKHYQT